MCSSAQPLSPPGVLLVGLLPGMGGMHLPRHLARAGLAVDFIGISGALASRSAHVRAFHPWQFGDQGLVVEPFVTCVQRWRPRWVIPLDEAASLVLQQIGVGRLRGGQVAVPDEVVALVRRSLGEPQGYPLHAARRRAFETARAADIPMAPQADVATLDDGLAFASRHGYPVVLKQESTMGGVGAFVLTSEAQLREFGLGGSFARAGGPPWVIQAFIPGVLGMHAVFADQGRVVAQLSAVQLRRRSERQTAPSSVVELCAHDAMAHGAAAFVRARGACGFHGWDFQIDEAGQAWMIEHNPRPISISHLGHLLGEDLCQALAATCGVPGAPVAAPSRSAGSCRVALFPDEWQRDAHSQALQTMFHDAPWDDRALFTALLQENMHFV